MPEEDKSPVIPGSDPTEQRPDIADAELVEADAPQQPDPVIPPTRPAPERRSGSFLGLVLGGAIAAGAGFGVAQLVPQVWPPAADDALRQQLAAQQSELAALKTSLAQLAERAAPDVSAELATLRAEVDSRLAAATPTDVAPALDDLRSAVDGALADFDTRLSAVEKAPQGAAGGASATAVAAYERDLQALRAQVEQLAGAGGAASSQIEEVVASAKAELAAATEEAARLKAEADATAALARRDAALGRLTAALEAGGPYSSALADLGDPGIEVPAILTDNARTGVQTLDDLQRQFPAAARAALEAALRSDVGAGWSDRLSTFLRTQTGARSLEPREGDDPDAVLSRAEAALMAGDLQGSLAELSALPDPAKAAMADWLGQAETRQHATDALSALVSAADGQ
jgi:hypothetical protein